MKRGGGFEPPTSGLLRPFGEKGLMSPAGTPGCPTPASAISYYIVITLDYLLLTISLLQTAKRIYF